MKHRTGYSLFLSLLLLGSGCGYSLSGMGNSLPPHMKRILVTVFQNESYEYGLESVITQELTASFNRRSGIKTVQKLSDADAILEGSIKSYEYVPTLNAQRQVTQYYINITAEVRLRDLIEDSVYWENKSYRFHEVYRISDGVSSVQTNRQEAWQDAAEDFAESIASILLEGF
ncbi:LptE family protein [bacterium]|nr:LptE family protein [candidate division CSSED10-310 bacterium]